jgi:hypothetical protein
MEFALTQEDSRADKNRPMENIKIKILFILVGRTFEKTSFKL